MSGEVKTPAEIAQQIVSGILDHPLCDTLAMSIVTAIRDAYECAAKTVEDWPDFRQWNAAECGATIRALKGGA